MKVMIAGAGGQLGFELQKIKPEQHQIIALQRQDLDITLIERVKRKILEIQPQLIINAAAYTAVDAAESSIQNATAVNVEGAANLAQIAKENKIRFIHISTDFVFDGKKSSPYLPQDLPNPLSIYGNSKWQGENKVTEILSDQALILRTSWVYSTHGKNFVKTILHLLNIKEELSVIADQTGTPTWARTLAMAIWNAAEKSELSGIYHWSDAGIASWYDFAIAIQEQAYDLKLLAHKIPIYPIRTTDYPLPAKRPAYAVLDKTATWRDFPIKPMHWRSALQAMLQELKYHA